MNKEYKELAKFYDLFYQNKDYQKEVDFLKNIFAEKNIKKILDVGCGTGKHIELLEKEGFECVGLDINLEMIDIAKKRTKAKLIVGDMRNFNLNRKFDAIICMFASFNQLTLLKEIKNLLKCFLNHLNQEGILVLDLHNPQKNGQKKDSFGFISREMIWKINPETNIEKTTIKFEDNKQTITDSHLMKIYSINEIKNLLLETGFKKINIFENYQIKKATNNSKNLEVAAIK